MVEGRTPLHKVWISEWSLWPEGGAWSPPAWLCITGIHPSDQRNVDALLAYARQYRQMGLVLAKLLEAGAKIPDGVQNSVLVAEIHLERSKSSIQRREVKIIPPNYPEWSFLWLAWMNCPWYCRWVDGDHSRTPQPFDEDDHDREPLGDVHEQESSGGTVESAPASTPVWSGSNSDDDDETPG